MDKDSIEKIRQRSSHIASQLEEVQEAFDKAIRQLADDFTPEAIRAFNMLRRKLDEAHGHVVANLFVARMLRR